MCIMMDILGLYSGGFWRVIIPEVNSRGIEGPQRVLQLLALMTITRNFTEILHDVIRFDFDRLILLMEMIGP